MSSHVIAIFPTHKQKVGMGPGELLATRTITEHLVDLAPSYGSFAPISSDAEFSII